MSLSGYTKASHIRMNQFFFKKTAGGDRTHNLCLRKATHYHCATAACHIQWFVHNSITNWNLSTAEIKLTLRGICSHGSIKGIHRKHAARSRSYILRTFRMYDRTTWLEKSSIPPMPYLQWIVSDAYEPQTLYMANQRVGYCYIQRMTKRLSDRQKQR